MSQNHETTIPKWVARWAHPKMPFWHLLWLLGVGIAGTYFIAWTVHGMRISNFMVDHTHLTTSYADSLRFVLLGFFVPVCTPLVVGMLPTLAELVCRAIAKRWLRAEWREATGTSPPKEYGDVQAALSRIAHDVSGDASYWLPRFYRARDVAAMLGWYCRDARVKDYVR